MLPAGTASHGLVRAHSHPYNLSGENAAGRIDYKSTKERLCAV